MAKPEIDLTWNPNEFVREVTMYRTKIEASVKILADVAAIKMENYAKEESIWQDRTGNARQTLKGSATWTSQQVVMIAVSHHQHYGYWLELAHGREYAILEESIEENVEELYNALRRLISKVN